MKSKNKSPFSRFLALMLAFVMTFTMMPATAGAAEQSSSREGTEGGTEDPMHYDKTVTLEDDGTYTIRMETYATGKVTTTKNQTPTDIVLVLDVSGSMKTGDFPAGESYVRFTRTTNSQAYSNQNNLYVLLDDGETYAKVTVSRSYQGGFWDGYYRYTYSAAGMTTVISDRENGTIPSPYNGRLYTLLSQDITRMEALQNAANAFVDATAEKNASIENVEQKHRISIVKFAGENENTSTGNDTYRDGGDVYNYSQIVRDLTVVDSQNGQSLKTSINNLVPNGSTAADKGLNRAEAALQSSPEDRNKVVVMFTDGEPNYFSGFDYSVAAETINKAKDLKDDGVTIYTISVMDDANPNDTYDKMNKYMNAVSSNYPDAEARNQWGNASWDNLTLGTGSNQSYYKVATNASELTDIFEEISNSVGSAAVELTKESVVRDVLADGFAFPASWSIDTIKEHVSVATADYLGNGNFGEEKAFNEAVININDAKDTIDVSGFDYAANYVVDASVDGDVKLNGKKLIITITGIEATDAAVTNAAVPTNKETSGIYEKADSEEAFRTFEVPTTMLTSKSYVLDFGKKVDLTSTDWRQNTVTTLDGDGMNAFASSENSLKETYGNVAQNGNTLTYEPKTTNWDGYDSFYVFGKTLDEDILAASANANGNVWSKINVIPATSVYYEDDFGYTSSGSKENGYTTIEYTGDWKTATSAGASDEPQSSDNVVYGTDSTYNDDLQYSDGSAHYAGTGATASFTFTGTGLEIYTSTNSDSGRVIVQIKGQTNGKIYTAIVDNEFTSLESGLYQIPTVFFQDVERDTYDATVTVIGDGEGNDTYYLDAIRVYNPLNGEDPIVSAAYADAYEADAVSEELRQYLIDASTVTNEETGETEITEPIDGAVYIDNLRGSTSEIGEYVSNGPKNEVYLEAGKSVAFQIDTEYTGQVLLGIKAPSGTASSVDVTYGNNEKDEIPITSATDMYYVIHPTDDGQVVITNTGNALISITKLRLTGVVAQENGISLKSTPELMSYAASFASLPYADNEAVENPDENTGNVDIENPEIPGDSTNADTPSDSTTGNSSIKDVITDVVNSLWNSIWNGFSSWLGRW